MKSKYDKASMLIFIKRTISIHRNIYQSEENDRSQCLHVTGEIRIKMMGPKFPSHHMVHFFPVLKQ